MSGRTTRIESNTRKIEQYKKKLAEKERELEACKDVTQLLSLQRDIDAIKQKINKLESSVSKYLGTLTEGQLNYLVRVGAKTPEEINLALVDYEKLYNENIKTLDAQQNGTGAVSAATIPAFTWRNWNNLTTGKPLLNAINNSYLFGIHTTTPNLPNGNILTLSDKAKNAYLSIPSNATNTNTSWLQRFSRTPLERSIDRAVKEAAAKGGTAASSIPKKPTLTLANNVAKKTSSLLTQHSDDILGETAKQAKHLNKVANTTKRAIAATSSWKSGWGAAFKSGFTKTNVALTVGAAAVSTGMEAVDDIREHGHLTERTGKAAVEEGLGAAGALACAGVGAKIGAAIGTAIPVPVLGTAVGFVVGAAIGTGGYFLGKGLGKLFNKLWQ